jgi:predicted metal-dependent HD superfamily phosphohydrolase
MNSDAYSKELLVNSWSRSYNQIYPKPNDLLRDTIIWRYSEPSRYYHNISHLIGSIQSFKQHWNLAENPEVLELAIWFHDVVYDINGYDNEFESYMFFKYNVEFNQNIEDQIYYLIEATRHDKIETNKDCQLLCDIDLVTLGAYPVLFDAYCQKIRLEYSHIPKEQYNQERIKILDKFLEKPYIYYNKLFRDRFEYNAQTNIKNERRRLL